MKSKPFGYALSMARVLAAMSGARGATLSVVFGGPLGLCANLSREAVVVGSTALSASPSPGAAAG